MSGEGVYAKLGKEDLEFALKGRFKDSRLTGLNNNGMHFDLYEAGDNGVNYQSNTLTTCPSLKNYKKAKQI